MESFCGRYVTVYNGEGYNYQGLKAEIEAQKPDIPWRGSSDTEVILAAVSLWGFEAALKKLNGMFALAVWDKSERRLLLARDRMGEKPLYYGWMGRTFLFGSELKALRRHPAFAAEVDRGALSLYLRHNYIPAPYSIYKGIHKLPPAHYLLLDPSRPGEPPEPAPYWSVAEAARTGRDDPFGGSEAEAVDELERLLLEAVKLRMVSDVPLGAFLSGGVDSSAVVALMQAQSPDPVRTFTIGFHEKGFDEAPYAKAVARHLGTAHTELYLNWDQALAVVPGLGRMYDEPFADSSQVPTHLVSRLAREQVTVSLSGDGGDELFTGYDRYFLGRRIWNKAAGIPPALRGGLRRVATSLSPAAWQKLLAPLGPLLPAQLRVRNPGDKVHDLADLLLARDDRAFYRALVSHFKNPAALVKGGYEPDTVLTGPAGEIGLPGFTERMMYWDQMSYLPDDILVKLDRASMAVSLESRVPLLDHRVVEFAWRLPRQMRLKDGSGKWLLRRVLCKYVPQSLIERPKMGFGVPIEKWLREDMRPWAEDLLSQDRLKREGFFDAAAVGRIWREHLSRERNWHYYLWDILMFQLWLEEANKDAPGYE